MKVTEERRIDRRFSDYCEVLREGTPKALGSSEPAPPDHRETIAELVRSRDPGAARQADEQLNLVWAEDEGRWQRRLSKFLDHLTPSGSKAFRALVS